MNPYFIVCKYVEANGKRYYANSFRIYGRGIIFDDVYGRKVMVQGDLEIIAKKDEEN